MLKDNKNNNVEEICKLIHFGFDLHKREIKYYSEIPNKKDYTGSSYPMKKWNNGGIMGFRGYANHSDPTAWTTLGVCIGNFNKGDFEFEFGVMFQANSKNNIYYCNPLCLSKEDDEALESDHSKMWYTLSDSEKLDYFIKAFTFMGFKKEDVIDVLNGKKTAREAYQNIAPEEIKYLQWVSRDRRYYWFNNNVAIEGSYGMVDLDAFPFPFKEKPILDCTKVNTSWMYPQSNKRGVELINVNENKNSITHSNLKNIVINEPIDLSLVDATNTVFGHHTVINLEWSIADLNTMDLTLAVDENGNRFVVDEKGRVQFDAFYNILTTSNSNLITDTTIIEVYANADNKKMAQSAINNNASGIGLVRTEHILKNVSDIKDLVNCFIWGVNNKLSDKIKRLQIKQALALASLSRGKKIIFRLFDFKLNELSKLYNLEIDKHFDYEDLFKERGARLLIDYPDLLKAQLEAIFAVAKYHNLNFDILVPMISCVYEFESIKEMIFKIAGENGITNFRIGGMIENVEIANDADLLAKEADFITFGTNDLTESVTGLDRNSSSIDFQILNEQVKSIIEEAVYRARVAKPIIPIGFCGDHGNYIDNLDFYFDVMASYISCGADYVEIANKVFEYKDKVKKEKQQDLVRVLRKIIDKQ